MDSDWKREERSDKMHFSRHSKRSSDERDHKWSDNGIIRNDKWIPVYVPIFTMPNVYAHFWTKSFIKGVNDHAGKSTDWLMNGNGGQIPMYIFTKTDLKCGMDIDSRHISA